MYNFISYFIPEKYLDDKELHRKSKFVIWFTELCIFISIPILIYTYFQMPSMSIVIVGSMMIGIMTSVLWIFKYSSSFILVTHIICGTFTLLFLGSPVESGGIFSPDMPTFYIIPVFAIVIGNLRIGIFYSILILAVFMGYHIQELNTVNSESRANANNLPADYYLMNLIANAFVIIFMVYRNEKMRLQSESEIKEINHIVSEKNKEITDSINYARRIQSAILPQKEYVNKVLPNSFFLYRPKDIVSGDFYWISERKGVVFIVVADCTGHGVPGAFMSVVGMNLLNEIVNHRMISNSSEILKELNAGVVSALQQKQTETNDGMDIALVKIASDKKSIEFAGGNRSLLHFRNGELTEHKPSKYPIGGFNSMMEKNFDSNTIEIDTGDLVYLSTDGFADQFGGEKNKKMTTKNFKRKLSQIYSMDLKAQEKELDHFFSEWKTGYEQTDDVLVAGIKF
jgi:hypothetical protein